MLVKERVARKGYEDICEKLVAKKEALEEEVRAMLKEEFDRIEKAMELVTDEVEVEVPDPVPASTEDFEEKAETEEPLY